MAAQLQPVIADTSQQVQLQQQQQQQPQQQQQVVAPVPTPSQIDETGHKRLHVTNIPFRFRDNDLKQMFGVSSMITTLPNKSYNDAMQ